MEVIRYMTGSFPTNTYLGYDEETKKAFIVDPGEYAVEITEKAKELGLDVEYIILTHAHADHIKGIPGFRKDFPQAKLVAHQDEREILMDAKLNCSIEIFGQKMEFDADVYVKDKDVIKVGNIDLSVLHTPGHTKGGMSLYHDGYLFSGDTLFRRSIGRSDFYSGDFRTLINSIKERIYMFPDETLVLPGHMEITTVGEEKRGNPFV